MSFSRVFVGRLHQDASENDVRKFFDGYGKLKTVMMKVGYCFVDFYNDKDADDAVYDLNFHEILGKQVVVEAAEGTDHTQNRPDNRGGADGAGYQSSRGGSYQRQPRGEERGAPRNDRGGYQQGGYGSSNRPGAGDRERGFRAERDVGGGGHSVERRENGGAGFRDREERSGGGVREERPPARPSYREGPDRRSSFQEDRGRDGPREGPRDDQRGGFRGGRGGFRGRGRGGYESRGGRGGYESRGGRGGYVSRNDNRDASFNERRRDFPDRGRGDRGDFGDRGRGRGGFGDRGRGGFGDRGRGRGMARGGSRIDKRWEVRIDNLSSRVSWQDLKDYLRELKFECTFAEAHIKQKNVGTVCFATKGLMEGAVDKINDTDLGGRNNQRKITATKLRDGISRSKTRSPEAASKSRSRSLSRSRSASANGITQSKSRSRSASK